MIYEHATITITAGREAEFERAFAAGAPPLFEQAEGCHGIELRRCIEEPTRYCLMVGWDSVEDHMVDFRESPLFAQWRAIVSEYLAAAPTLEHYSTLVS